jgi:hypothetical protein
MQIAETIECMDSLSVVCVVCRSRKRADRDVIILYFAVMWELDAFAAVPTIKAGTGRLQGALKIEETSDDDVVYNQNMKWSVVIQSGMGNLPYTEESGKP